MASLSQRLQLAIAAASLMACETAQQEKEKAASAAVAAATAAASQVEGKVAAAGKTLEKAAKKVGSSLHKKIEMAVGDLPKEVVELVQKARPGITITGAEKELKHGKTYIDVEAKDSAGKEIEFDTLLGEKGWSIAEVQRDLAFADVPEPVRASLLEKVPGAKPARVIESDQGDGVIVYEFYTVSEGKEAKHEVKFSGGKAEFLKEEWKH